ncbi:TetR/AcrR family transcriptional regulator [Nocardiopsis tropica]
MARYSPEHKEATRRRMVEAAGRRFKSNGIDGSGIATLVADVGLTNGAFYGHFSSKDDLVANVVAQQLAQQTAVLNALPAGRESVETFVGQYLSGAHRDDLAGGCPSAALLDEIGRCDASVREAYTDGVTAMIEAIARHLDDGDSRRTEARAIGLLSLLVGALQTARAVTDPEVSEQILAAAFSNAMIIAGLSSNPAPPTRQEQR